MESSNWNELNRSQPTLQIPYSLLGRNITVYRGGPESKTGKLLDIKEDCVVIYADNKTIYYRTEHIKSITEDLKANAIQSINPQEDNPFFYQEEDFLSLLSNFLNKKIQIDQGGPDSKQGILLVVGSDYLVLSTEDDGIVYYNLHHIKSIMGLEENPNILEEDTEESSSNWVNEEESTEDMLMSNILRGSDFHHVCSLMSHKWVSINRKGPEALEGIFVDSSEGFFTLANNQELYRIHPFHVKNISVGPKGAMKQQQNNQQEEQTEAKTEETKDESTSEYTITTSFRTDVQRERYRTWGRREDRETSRNRSTSRRRNTSRRRSSSSYRTDEKRRSSRNRRSTSRRRRTSSRRTSRGRRWNRSSSSYYRTGRNETVTRSVNFNWRSNS